MKTILLLLGLLIVSALAKKPADQYYKEIGCKPVIESVKSEPTKYDCSHLNNVKGNQCYHRGKVYDIGQQIPESEVSPCLANCHCQGRDGKASLNCIKVECPPMRYPPKEGEVCYPVYQHDQCCPKYRCVEAKVRSSRADCEYEGKKYLEGETIQRDTTKEKVFTACICQKGFNGKIEEPWCKEKHCDLYVHYGDRLRKGCIPTYYKATDFCPIPEFRCPSEKDQVEGESSLTNKEDVCSFGKLKLHIGQRLNKASAYDQVTCTCQVPPHVTCVHN